MLRILPESWQRALGLCLESTLPHTCLLCGCDSNSLLCCACTADIPLLPAACPQCAESVANGQRCGRCLGHPPHFDATFAAFVYEFPLDRLIHAYKYGSELALAPWFAKQLAAPLANRHFDHILPLPLHPSRLCERGFNQSSELAKNLGKLLKVPVDVFSCRRHRATLPQAALPKKKRAANVRGAFECTRSYAGEHLLLIDDVMTTGMTANECARTLKMHDAASVTVGVIARALRL